MALASGSLVQRARSSLRPTNLLFTLVVFALVRAAFTCFILLVNPTGSQPTVYVLSDKDWYLLIAEGGYPDEQPSPGSDSAYAFFPLLPVGMRALHFLGINPIAAGILIAFVASIAAAWAIFRIGERLFSSQVGFYLAMSWAVIPTASIALSLPLTESVFTALAAWSLLLLLRKQLIQAALVAVLAGLTRPTAVAVILALWAVVIANLLNRRQVRESLLAFVVAPLGFVSYLGFVAVRTQRIDGYLEVQRSWDSQFTFGSGWRTALTFWLSKGLRYPIAWFTVATLLVLVLLLAAFLLMRLPMPLVVYVLVLLITVLGPNGIEVQLQRLIVPAFPLLIPVAVGLTRLPKWSRTAILAGFFALSLWNAVYLVSSMPNPLVPS